MLDNARECNKVSQQPLLPAMTATLAPEIALSGGEESRVGAGRSDGESYAFRASGTVAFVGGRVAIHIDAAVDIAASEVDADESAARGFALLAATVGRRVIGQIEMFADHVTTCL